MARPLAGPQSLLRTLNGRAILETLARRGPLTRAELVAETGLSRTAVTQVLRMLENSAAVVPAGVDRETRGPAAGRVALHPQLGFAAAVHVDNHAAHVALVDPTGAVRAEQHAPFPPRADRVEHIAALVEGCRRALNGPLHLVVVGIPGIVTADGGIRDDQGPDGGAFRAALSARLGCPVRVENDVNLAALAELTEGTGADLASFALLLLDDGLGAGIVLDGILHRGFSGVAGEVMYLPQSPLPIGAPVLGDEVVRDLALAHGRDPDATIDQHLDAASAGDEAARAMAAEMGRRLTLVAGSVALVLDPEAFILGGTAAHPALFEAALATAEELAAQLPIRLLVSSFGPEAPLVGAVGEAAAALRATVFSHAVPGADRSRR
ncbi:ROK family transcriptional regulator [Microbacterium hydrocarbonoxydans]|uniref:Sugar kinase of the NBD/HSP70 family, may contain an N-terminal HTH domain n=2 Tax=Microbacterium hydrocarbonoxydans TaxID=273678 RepID=A0A1H4JGE0_9MICO|nr:ROK family transcriptional regulator [Microbacterium hydrocarbonoxydans]SEB44996.1 Sugar kinase of the NBD/HSP70 family, may contain an N-terminal HTH domain [Microbacterium hydrocarbonoxydans]